MKASERHHLKTNEFARSVNRTREVLVERQRSLTAGLVIAAIVLVGLAFYFGQRSRTQSRAGAMLAEATAILSAPVVPPPTPGVASPPPQPGSFSSEAARAEAAVEKLLAAAQAYPSTASGRLARFRAAEQLAGLGKLSEAEQQFTELRQGDASGLYGRMATLGLAAVQLRAGKHDQAIAGFKQVVERPETDLPLDGVLMELGRAYAAAGNADEARKTFTRVIDEFPQSVYAAEARRQVDLLGGGSAS